MNDLTKNKCYIYKNDLKFNNNIDLEHSDFESDDIRLIYDNYKNKPKIELRIKETEMENYEYLDLSDLDIDDQYLIELFKLERIKNIIEKIIFLDLSSNRIKQMPDISKYKNIIYINLSNNKLTGSIIDDNIIELTCHNNNISEIKSKSLLRLNACNNLITELLLPKIEVLIINFNKLNYLQSYINLKYLECINNQLFTINNMINLEELYVGTNNIVSIESMPKLKLLNCTNNPIDKINFFENLNMLVTSTPNISSKYKIININKIKKDYLINFKR